MWPFMGWMYSLSAALRIIPEMPLLSRGEHPRENEKNPGYKVF
jgi:hypothetical protein